MQLAACITAWIALQHTYLAAGHCFALFTKHHKPELIQTVEREAVRYFWSSYPNLYCTVCFLGCLVLHCRFPNGESGADVYDRITVFTDHLIRDINAGRFANNTSLVLVTHGLALRIFLMRW